MFSLHKTSFFSPCCRVTSLGDIRLMRTLFSKEKSGNCLIFLSILTSHCLSSKFMQMLFLLLNISLPKIPAKPFVEFSTRYFIFMVYLVFSSSMKILGNTVDPSTISADFDVQVLRDTLASLS